MRGDCDPPTGLSSDQLATWQIAFQDGQICRSNGGLVEQNPYSIHSSPLFDAWDAGWLNADYEVTEPLKPKAAHHQRAIQEKLWKQIISRA